MQDRILQAEGKKDMEEEKIDPVACAQVVAMVKEIWQENSFVVSYEEGK